MKVVLGDLPLDDFLVHGLAHLPDQLSNPDCHLVVQSGRAVLGDPNDTEF